jgi:hypothetical protein
MSEEKMKASTREKLRMVSGESPIGQARFSAENGSEVNEGRKERRTREDNTRW